jgi:predicted transcriptional regulator
MKTKVMKVGIISRDDYRKRTIAIASGTYKPKKSEPKIWFESLNSMAQVLSSENQNLLRLIIEHQPRSLAELERISSRKKSNLSRTLKTLERYGVVELTKVNGKLVPKVKVTDFDVKFGLNYSKPETDSDRVSRVGL